MNDSKYNSIDIPADVAFQKKEWQLQRVGWFVWAGVMIAGLLGLLGPGPLSRRVVSDPKSLLTLEFDRYLQYHQPAALKFTLARTSAQPELFLSRPFLEAIQITRIEPEPRSARALGDGIEYCFFAGDGTAGKVQEPITVTFFFEYQTIGRAGGTARMNDLAEMKFAQFVYP